MNSKARKMPWGIGVLLLAALMVAAACAPATSPPPTSAPPVATATTAAAKPSPAAPTAPAAQASPVAKAAPAAQASPAGKLTTVKFGSPGSISDAGVFIGVEKGYFKDLGLDVQILPFQSGPVMIAPLAAGELDVAGGSISTGLFNAIDRGVALKIVAGKGSSVKGFEFSIVSVRKQLLDSGQVKEVKDFKGKNFALASLQSGAEAIANYFLKQGGLSTKDVNLVVLGYPDQLAAYSNNAIDLAIAIEPTLSDTVQKSLAVRWPPGATSTIYGGEYQAAELVYSEQFSKNTDVARRFMVGYVKALRDYNDAFAKGKDKAGIVSILIKDTSVKDPAAYDQMAMPFLNPDGGMHVPSMQMDVDYFNQMGYYTGKTQLKSIIDTQFTDYAVQQLGPYK
ncbi:MAG: ABC transporter substrate-binding protein [Dehalococcoidia bacterium]|nr:ABC transporter substrate-binding protein [Dehalococcoidia bacterium]